MSKPGDTLYRVFEGRLEVVELLEQHKSPNGITVMPSDGHPVSCASSLYHTSAVMAWEARLLHLSQLRAGQVRTRDYAERQIQSLDDMIAEVQAAVLASQEPQL